MTTLAAKPDNIINYDEKIYRAAIAACLFGGLSLDKFFSTQLDP
jgi:hypothetical protein